MRREGEVTWFNDHKGYGFITGDDGLEVLVQYTEIMRDGFQTLEPGERVTYGVIDEDIGPKAVEVRLEADANKSNLL